MIRPILLAVLFLLSFAMCNQTFAQTDSGTYVVLVGGQALSEESYSSERGADGSLKTTSKIATNTMVTITKNHQPVEFWVEAGGAKALTTSFANGTAKTSITGQADKTDPTNATVVSENNVWSHFIHLLAQYDAGKGGIQNFVGYLPSKMMSLPLTLEKTETKDYKINGQTISLSKFRLVHTRGNLAVDILADKNNIPLLIEIPAQQVQVIRKGFEELLPKGAAVAPQSKTFAGEFTSEEVNFPNGEITLAGTLTLPKNDKKSFPAFVIITGSGSQDRDGTALFNMYKQVAESLSQAGVAVLRVDDRGVGKSTIIREKAPETSYRDLISDSQAAFNYLMTRNEIDKSKVGLIGHSEGSETALTIASEDPRVAAIILLSGTSRPISQGVVEQEFYQRAIQGTINVSDKTKVMPVAQNIINQFEAAKLAENAQNKRLSWFREHLQSDPSQLAQKIKCPVLIVQGERDLLVLAYHSVELATAISKNGNKEVSLRILPNLTHIFTPISENQAEATKVSSDLLTTLQNWAATTLIN